MKKKKLKLFNFNTLSLHSGQNLDNDFASRALPIYQTTSYVFKNASNASSIFNLEQDGHLYSRISNPTVSALEERLASLEKGIGAICTASGQAALHLTIATLLNAGDHIVSSNRITPPIYSFILSDEKSISLNNSLFCELEVTSTAFSLFVMVPLLSSAARMPFPLEIILRAILLRSDISV